MRVRALEPSGSLFATDEQSTKPTRIPGVLVVDLVVREDFRGWSKELDAWGPASSPTAGPGFAPTRWASNHNRRVGVTRGVHAELANKYVSLASGEALAAIVDLREGATFGIVELVHLTAAVALYIPIGCGNSYQTLTPDVCYSYLADDNIGAETSHVGVNLADPDLAIPWPVPLNEASMADSDRFEPALVEVVPISPAELARLRAAHQARPHPSTTR